MPSPSGSGNFVEINDHSVIVIRTSPSNGASRIETWREIALQNRMEAAEAIRGIFPEGSADAPVAVQCAVRPAQRAFKIASADEARQHATAAAARALVTPGLPAGFETSEIACMYANDGRLLGGGAPNRWIAAAVSRESLDAASAMLTEWNLKATRIEPAAFGFLGAGRAALATRRTDEPLVVWDAAANTSDVFLLTSAGVEATRRIEFGYEQVFDALLTEIQLKFKGAAVRLFFNDRYDFSDAGPKIANRVAAVLHEALAALALQAGGRMPVAFCCSSMPAKQAWFNTHLSAALHLNVWTPDIAAWAASVNITFADASVIETLLPNSLGALSLVAASHQRPEAEAWHAAWVGGATEAAPVAKPAPAPVAPARPAPAPLRPAPAPVAARTPTPVAKPIATPAPVAKPVSTPAPVAAPAVAEPVRVAARATAVAATATADASRAALKRPVPAPAFPSPSKKREGEGNSSSVTSPPANATPPPAPVPAAAPAGSAPRKSSSKIMLYAGIAAGVVLLGGGYFVVNMFSQQKAAAAQAQAEAEHRAAELAEANRQAELKAQAETEARKKAEEQIAQQQKAVELARQQAEAEARAREADRDRLLNARGSLVIKTEPADATVVVGNLASRPTPAVFHDLRLGHYPVEITKPGFDTLKFEVEIKENVVADQGALPLIRQTGALTIESTPAGASYSVQRTGEVSFSLERTNQYKGVTPANLKDLPTGDYTVTVERSGWAAVTRTVKVENKGSARVSEAFNGGIVSITSVPEGAQVFANNVSLGRAPLKLTNVSPGKVTYRLELPDHHPATVGGTAQVEKTLELWSSMVPIEKLARIADIEVQPKPIKMVQPKLPKNATTLKGVKVLISVVIDETGQPRDWRVIDAADPALADACIEAIAQWRFEPARANGQPVKVRVTVPMNFN